MNEDFMKRNPHAKAAALIEGLTELLIEQMIENHHLRDGQNEAGARREALVDLRRAVSRISVARRSFGPQLCLVVSDHLTALIEAADAAAYEAAGDELRLPAEDDSEPPFPPSRDAPARLSEVTRRPAHPRGESMLERATRQDNDSAFYRS